jgi:hypothetical protein
MWLAIFAGIVMSSDFLDKFSSALYIVFFLTMLARMDSVTVE